MWSAAWWCRVLHRAAATDRSVPRAITYLPDRPWDLRPRLADGHGKAPGAYRRLSGAPHLECGGVGRLRRNTRTNERALHARRRVVGAGVVDDDRSRVGRPPHCAG